MNHHNQLVEEYQRDGVVRLGLLLVDRGAHTCTDLQLKAAYDHAVATTRPA